MMPFLVAARTARPVVHGAPDYDELARLGLSPDDVLDFSVNSNPYGPSPRVREALALVPLERYPDRESLALRAALADHLGVPREHIVVGNGVSELILLAALAYLAADRRALVIGPTFGEYARAAQIMGATVAEWRALPDQDFTVDISAIVALARQAQPHVAFLCNPNNPTGMWLPPEAVAALADAVPSTLWLVDEAYLPFVTGAPSAIGLRRPNIVVLRSLTKDCALAGLRLGYAVGPEMPVAALAAVRPAWNVNALAQAAGLAALADAAYTRRTLDALQQHARELATQLRAVDLHVYPSALHYMLVEVGDGAAVRRRLLQHRLLVRDGASFGLPSCIRVAARLPDDNARLVAALAEVKA